MRLVELEVLDRRRRRQLGSRRKPHRADLLRIDAPLGGVGAHQLDRLQHVVHRVDLGDVAVLAKPVAQDDGVDAVVEEEGDEVRSLRADHEVVVPAARHDDHGRAGVVPAGAVQLNRRVVDVDDGVDAARYGRR